MDREEHIRWHKEAHRNLDKLMADFLRHTELLLSKTSVMDLAEWSYEQTINPAEE